VTKRLEIDQNKLRMKFLVQNVDFSCLSFDLLDLNGSLEWGYSFQTHYYFIAHCTLIPQVATPMLSRVT